MKIIKLNNGNVLIEENGKAEYSFPPNMVLLQSEVSADTLLICNSATNGDIGESLRIKASEVEATVLNGIESVFKGGVSELINILSRDFFVENNVNAPAITSVYDSAVESAVKGLAEANYSYALTRDVNGRVIGITRTIGTTSQTKTITRNDLGQIANETNWV